jgi:hypothetical protein
MSQVWTWGREGKESAMNPNDCGTVEACQRLVDAGIVLETDMWWTDVNCITGDPPVWGLVSEKEYPDDVYIPAPSMAEVWRELPEEYEKCPLAIIKHADGTHIAGYLWDYEWNINRFNINPTDALIDLLIFITTQKEGK